MILRLNFKTPDVLEEATKFLDVPENEDERYYMWRDIYEACDQWIRNEESITIEIDTETGECTPVRIEV